MSDPCDCVVPHCRGGWCRGPSAEPGDEPFGSIGKEIPGGVIERSVHGAHHSRSLARLQTPRGEELLPPPLGLLPNPTPTPSRSPPPPR
jgi:hypothetical protein